LVPGKTEEVRTPGVSHTGRVKKRAQKIPPQERKKPMGNRAGRKESLWREKNPTTGLEAIGDKSSGGFGGKKKGGNGLDQGWGGICHTTGGERNQNLGGVVPRRKNQNPETKEERGKITAWVKKVKSAEGKLGKGPKAPVFRTWGKAAKVGGRLGQAKKAGPSPFWKEQGDQQKKNPLKERPPPPRQMRKGGFFGRRYRPRGTITQKNKESVCVVEKEKTRRDDPEKTLATKQKQARRQ